MSGQGGAQPGVICPPRRDKTVQLEQLLQADRGLHVERLEIVTEVAIDVFVIVAEGQVAQLPGEALAGPALSSLASIVLLRLGAPAGGAFGTCRRWLQAGQFLLVPAWSAGASSGFLQLGQLYLIGGFGGAALSSPASIVLFRLGGAADSCFDWAGT